MAKPRICRIGHPKGLELKPKEGFFGNANAFQDLLRIPWETQLELLADNDFRFRDTVDSFTILYDIIEVPITPPEQGTKRETIMCPVCGRELKIEVGDTARLIEDRDLPQSRVHDFKDVTADVEAVPKILAHIKQQDVAARRVLAPAAVKGSVGQSYFELVIAELLKDPDDSVRTAVEGAVRDVKEGRVAPAPAKGGCATVVLLGMFAVLCYFLF
jgi:hypothetical protein